MGAIIGTEKKKGPLTAPFSNFLSLPDWPTYYAAEATAFDTLGQQRILHDIPVKKKPRLKGAASLTGRKSAQQTKGRPMSRMNAGTISLRMYFARRCLVGTKGQVQ